MKNYFTSVVRCKGPEGIEVVPVRSLQKIEIIHFVELSKVLSKIYVGRPVHKGDLICSNVLNKGIDIIATKTML